MPGPYRAAAKPQKRRGPPGIECVACGMINPAHRDRCECGFGLKPKPDEVRRLLATQADAKTVQILLGIAAILAASAFSYATDQPDHRTAANGPSPLHRAQIGTFTNASTR